MTEPPLPQYHIEIVPCLVKTPKPGEPAGFTHEAYVEWIADEEHQRMEEQAEANKLWFWAAKISEKKDGKVQSTEVHDQPFFLDHNTGYTQLREFTKALMKQLTKRAAQSLGEDPEPRIIIT